jgi:hypothetical protein
MLSPAPGPDLPDVLRSVALDDPTARSRRAPGWLDVTCSNCHRPGFGRGFDARFTTARWRSARVRGGWTSRFRPPDHAGSPALSTLGTAWPSAARRAMPPLAKAWSRAGARVLGAWIERIDELQARRRHFDYYG